MMQPQMAMHHQQMMGIQSLAGADNSFEQEVQPI